ncbi:MAG: hypothetical protein GF364_09700 [Candidatus Lokiarchaeota archaeon]|nr:hypothetical protein [Candidatus Lokiarchaeota archaeon]
MEFIMYLYAIVAGLGSFFNPCSIVMLPSFLAFVGAESTDLKKGFFLSLVYGLGFTVLFAIVGTALLFVPGFLIKQRWIQLVGAILTIIIGIIVGSGFLNRRKESQSPLPSNNNPEKKPIGGVDKRGFIQDDDSQEIPQNEEKLPTFGPAFTLGLSHGTAGMGCAGPILASVVTSIISSGDIAAGWFALTLYAIGLILPFLLIGIFIGKINEFMILKIARFSNKLRIILAIVIIGIGFYFLYDSLLLLGIISAD